MVSELPGVITEIFGHNRLRSWCLQVQPVGHLLTSSGFPLLDWGIYILYFL